MTRCEEMTKRTRYNSQTMYNDVVYLTVGVIGLVVEGTARLLDTHTKAKLPCTDTTPMKFLANDAHRDKLIDSIERDKEKGSIRRQLLVGAKE